MTTATTDFNFATMLARAKEQIAEREAEDAKEAAERTAKERQDRVASAMYTIIKYLPEDFLQALNIQPHFEEGAVNPEFTFTVDGFEVHFRLDTYEYRDYGFKLAVRRPDAAEIEAQNDEADVYERKTISFSEEPFSAHFLERIARLIEQAKTPRAPQTPKRGPVDGPWLVKVVYDANEAQSELNRLSAVGATVRSIQSNPAGDCFTIVAHGKQE